MKKILKIIGVTLLVLVLVAIAMFVVLIRNPGLYLRLVSEKLSEDKAAEAFYNYDFDDTSRIKSIPYFYFTPSESGNYTFSAVDLESSDEVYLTMSVMDKDLDDYFIADNRDYETGGQKDTMSDSTALQKSQTCYILFTVEPIDGDLAQFSGSFKVIVTKESDEGPPKLTTEESVTIKVDAEGHACAAFVPPETGYYRFEHSIVSHDSTRGYSSISSITASNKRKVGVTNDISRLQKGKEYYVWATTNETNSRNSEIELWCLPMNTEEATGICALEIDGDSVIEYVAEKDCDLAVYTVSEGDPRLVIYEKDGFPLRNDDKTEASLSDNPDDIATVLRVEKGTKLRICVFGQVTGCRVVMTEYTGDGTSLTIDDLVPVPESGQTAADDEADSDPAEESAGENESNENSVEEDAEDVDH